MRRIDTRALSLDELHQALRRPEVDEMTVGRAVAERLHELFGRELTPAEAVAEIVGDVAARGDAAVLDYSRRIDGAELVADSLFVTEEEWAAARDRADPNRGGGYKGSCRTDPGFS